MSTIIHVVPVAHATKRTTGIAIENDGVLRTRVEAPIGTAVDKRFNFATDTATSTAYGEGTSAVINNEPVVLVAAEKIGTTARFIIQVTEFYAATLLGDDAPQERYLWYDYKVKAEDAPDSTVTQTASPSSPLWVLWSSGGTPAAPTVAFNVVAQNTKLASEYTRLATLAARRETLKLALQADVFNPALPVWLVDNSEDERSAFIRRFEMLTRALSIDANLNTEAKFNLLAGEIGLDAYTVAMRISSSIVSGGGVGSLHGADRGGWQFFRLGSLGTGPAFPYSPPSTTNYIAYTSDVAGITLSGVPAAVSANDGRGWLDWLRIE